MKRLCPINGMILLCFLVSSITLLQAHLWQYLPGKEIPAELREINQTLWNYLLHGPSTNLPDIPASLREKRHMLDVKRLLDSLHNIALLSGLYCFLVLMLPNLRRCTLKMTAVIGLSSLLLLAIAYFLFGFRPLFVLMHRIAFPIDTWWFASDSLLIQLFPLSTFQETALSSGLVLLLILLIFWRISNKIPVRTD